MYKKELFHSYNKNRNIKKEGLLEDYAYLINALILAYEYTYDEKYLNFAKKLAYEVRAFKKDVWYMNKNHTVKADYSDSAYASSLSVLANDFLVLSLLLFDMELKQEADDIIKNGGYFVNSYPLYYPSITKAYLKSTKAYVISSEKPLYKNEFSYPYILWKKGENFEICTYDRCIKKSDDFFEVLREIR